MSMQMQAAHDNEFLHQGHCRVSIVLPEEQRGRETMTWSIDRKIAGAFSVALSGILTDRMEKPWGKRRFAPV